MYSDKQKEMLIMTKEQQIKEVLKLMNETLDNNEWKELLKIYLELKQ